MESAVKNLADHLRHLEETAGVFESAPHYEPKTDSLVYFLRDVSSYAKRITKFFSVYLSNYDDTLVGVEVNRVTMVLNMIEEIDDFSLTGDTDVEVKDEDGKCYILGAFIRAAIGPEPDEPIEPSDYEELKKATRGVRLKKRDLCPA